MITLHRSEASRARERDAGLAQARAAINARVGDLRGRFITPIPGQDMIYSAKEQEARAFQAKATPPADLAAFPFMAAEIGITAPDAARLAALWVRMADEWRQIGPRLEALRLGALAEVEAAATPEGQAAALERFEAAAAAFSVTG